MPEFPIESLTSRVAFVDPAGTKTVIKSQRAEQAIVTIGGDDLGRIFVLEQWGGRLSTEKFIDRIIETDLRWHPPILACEANAMQELFVGSAMIVARLKGAHLNLYPYNPPTHVDKDWFIRTALQPILGKGRLFLGPHCDELQQQILAFPSGKRKDRIDALAKAISLLPTRTVKKQKSDSLEALALYLRKVGAPPHIIEQRLRFARQARGIEA